MGLMSGMASGYLRQMPLIDARHQRETENERADLKQEMWLRQQERVQDEYERQQRERAANRMLLSNPTKYRGLMNLEGPMRPENQDWMQSVQSGASPEMLLQMGRYQTPEEKAQQALMLKLAGRTGDSGKPMPTFSANGRRMQPRLVDGVWKNVDVGEDTKKSLVDLGGESEFTKKMGGYGAEMMHDLKTKADESTKLLGDLQYILDSKSEAGGPGSNFWLGVKQVLHRMGVPIKNMGQEEMLQALGNQFAVAARGGAFSGGKPLTGNTSDSDMRRLYASVPSLAQTPEGRKLIAEMLKSKAVYDINKWKTYQSEYIKGGKNFDPYSYRYGAEGTGDEEFQKLLKRAEELAAKAPSNPTVSINPSGGKPSFGASLIAPFNRGDGQAPAGSPAPQIKNPTAGMTNQQKKDYWMNQQ